MPLRLVSLFLSLALCVQLVFSLPLAQALAPESDLQLLKQLIVQLGFADAEARTHASVLRQAGAHRGFFSFSSRVDIQEPNLLGLQQLLRRCVKGPLLPPDKQALRKQTFENFVKDIGYCLDNNKFIFFEGPLSWRLCAPREHPATYEELQHRLKEALANQKKFQELCQQLQTGLRQVQSFAAGSAPPTASSRLDVPDLLRSLKKHLEEQKKQAVKEVEQCLRDGDLKRAEEERQQAIAGRDAVLGVVNGLPVTLAEGEAEPAAASDADTALQRIQQHVRQQREQAEQSLRDGDLKRAEEERQQAIAGRDAVLGVVNGLPVTLAEGEAEPAAASDADTALQRIQQHVRQQREQAEQSLRDGDLKRAEEERQQDLAATDAVFAVINGLDSGEAAPAAASDADTASERIALHVQHKEKEREEAVRQDFEREKRRLESERDDAFTARDAEKDSKTLLERQLQALRTSAAEDQKQRENLQAQVHELERELAHSRRTMPLQGQQVDSTYREVRLSLQADLGSLAESSSTHSATSWVQLPQAFSRQELETLQGVFLRGGLNLFRSADRRWAYLRTVLPRLKIFETSRRESGRRSSMSEVPIEDIQNTLAHHLWQAATERDLPVTNWQTLLICENSGERREDLIFSSDQISREHDVRDRLIHLLSFGQILPQATINSLRQDLLNQSAVASENSLQRSLFLTEESSSGILYSKENCHSIVHRYRAAAFSLAQIESLLLLDLMSDLKDSQFFEHRPNMLRFIRLWQIYQLLTCLDFAQDATFPWQIEERLLRMLKRAVAAQSDHRLVESLNSFFLNLQWDALAQTQLYVDASGSLDRFLESFEEETLPRHECLIQKLGEESKVTHIENFKYNVVRSRLQSFFEEHFVVKQPDLRIVKEQFKDQFSNCLESLRLLGQDPQLQRLAEVVTQLRDDLKEKRKAQSLEQIQHLQHCLALWGGDSRIEEIKRDIEEERFEVALGTLRGLWNQRQTTLDNDEDFALNPDQVMAFYFQTQLWTVCHQLQKYELLALWHKDEDLVANLTCLFKHLMQMDAAKRVIYLNSLMHPLALTMWYIFANEQLRAIEAKHSGHESAAQAEQKQFLEHQSAILSTTDMSHWSNASDAISEHNLARFLFICIQYGLRVSLRFEQCKSIDEAVTSLGSSSLNWHYGDLMGGGKTFVFQAASALIMAFMEDRTQFVVSPIGFQNKQKINPDHDHQANGLPRISERFGIPMFEVSTSTNSAQARHRRQQLALEQFYHFPFPRIVVMNKALYDLVPRKYKKGAILHSEESFLHPAVETCVDPLDHNVFPEETFDGRWQPLLAEIQRLFNSMSTLWEDAPAESPYLSILLENRYATAFVYDIATWIARLWEQLFALPQWIAYFSGANTQYKPIAEQFLRGSSVSSDNLNTCPVAIKSLLLVLKSLVTDLLAFVALVPVQDYLNSELQQVLRTTSLASGDSTPPICELKQIARLPGVLSVSLESEALRKALQSARIDDLFQTYATAPTAYNHCYPLFVIARKTSHDTLQAQMENFKTLLKKRSTWQWRLQKGHYQPAYLTAESQPERDTKSERVLFQDFSAEPPHPSQFGKKKGSRVSFQRAEQKYADQVHAFFGASVEAEGDAQSFTSLQDRLSSLHRAMCVFDQNAQVTAESRGHLAMLAIRLLTEIFAQIPTIKFTDLTNNNVPIKWDILQSIAAVPPPAQNNYYRLGARKNSANLVYEYLGKYLNDGSETNCNTYLLALHKAIKDSCCNLSTEQQNFNINLFLRMPSIALTLTASSPAGVQSPPRPTELRSQSDFLKILKAISQQYSRLQEVENGQSLMLTELLKAYMAKQGKDSRLDPLEKRVFEYSARIDQHVLQEHLMDRQQTAVEMCPVMQDALKQQLEAQLNSNGRVFVGDACNFFETRRALDSKFSELNPEEYAIQKFKEIFYGCANSAGKRLAVLKAGGGVDIYSGLNDAYRHIAGLMTSEDLNVTDLSFFVPITQSYNSEFGIFPSQNAQQFKMLIIANFTTSANTLLQTVGRFAGRHRPPEGQAQFNLDEIPVQILIDGILRDPSAGQYSDLKAFATGLFLTNDARVVQQAWTYVGVDQQPLRANDLLPFTPGHRRKRSGSVLRVDLPSNLADLMSGAGGIGSPHSSSQPTSSLFHENFQGKSA